MYLQCVNCQKLGIACDGPNFLAMSPQQLIVWCKERKKHLGYTNAKLAELSNMPQGTVDSLLANSHADFKFGTIRPILQALVGGDWSGDPCPGASDDEEKELRERIRQLEAAIQWRDDKIQHISQEYRAAQESAADASKRHAKSQDFLRDQIRGKNKTIVVLSVLLGLALSVIIAALVVDYLNRHIGFFWIDKVTQLFESDGHGLLERWIT